MTPDVSVTIVTFECGDEARACLESLYRTTTGLALEVVVVDNASTDGTVDLLRAEFPAARVVPLDENVGFAAGMNRAVAESTGEFVLLLNPDTLVHPGTVEHVVAFARAHPEHGIYGGRTLDPDGRVNPGSCWGRPTLWSYFCAATMLSTVFKRSRIFDPQSLGRWERDTVREVDVVTGCFLLAPRSVWQELGGFDERFFMYGEDVDLGLRAAARGYRPVITPDAVITHEIGVSSATRTDKLVLLYRAKVELVRKHFGPVQRRLAVGLLWSGVGLRALLARATGRGASTVWPDAWRVRKRWLLGYPPRVAAAEDD